jgi:trk system potassium uptake protein TrkA
VLAFGKKDQPVDVPDDDLSLENGDRLIILADFEVLGDVRSIVSGETSRAAAGGA